MTSMFIIVAISLSFVLDSSTSAQDHLVVNKNGNWCAVLYSKQIPCREPNGTETYIARQRAPCTYWNYSNCDRVTYRTLTRLKFVTKYKTVKDTVWKCCKGYYGSTCNKRCTNCTGLEGAIEETSKPFKTDQALDDGSSYSKQYQKDCPVSAGKPGPKGQKGDRGLPGSDNRKRIFSTGQPSVRGPRGEPGPPGDPGPQGLQGIPGVQGPPGLHGLEGRRGPPGPEGARGHPGFPGSPGIGGSQERPGTPGPPGLPGRPGEPGLGGVQGPPGLPGPPGVPGLNAKAGEDQPADPPRISVELVMAMLNDIENLKERVNNLEDALVDLNGNRGVVSELPPTVSDYDDSEDYYLGN